MTKIISTYFVPHGLIEAQNAGHAGIYPKDQFLAVVPFSDYHSVRIQLEQYKRDAERMREALESIRSMTSADDPESYRSDDPEGCLDAVFGAAEQALSTQSDHIEDKLKMVKPECACRVESDDKFGSLIYKCPQHDNSIEGQQAEVKS